MAKSKSTTRGRKKGAAAKAVRPSARSVAFYALDEIESALIDVESTFRLWDTLMDHALHKVGDITLPLHRHFETDLKNLREAFTQAHAAIGARSASAQKGGGA
jgi:hypothetical protein